MIRRICKGVIKHARKRQRRDIRRHEQDIAEPIGRGIRAGNRCKLRVALHAETDKLWDPGGEAQQAGAGAGPGLQNALSGAGRHRCREQDRLYPADIARMVLFLAADDSRMCSSQNFIVDGGWV